MAAVEEHPDRQLYAEQVAIAVRLVIQHLPRNDPLRQLLVEGRDLDPSDGSGWVMLSHLMPDGQVDGKTQASLIDPAP